MADPFPRPFLLLAALAFFAAAQGAAAQEAPQADADRVAVVRATFEPVSPAVLEIKEPIRVTQCIHQRVPVVIGLVFTDAGQMNHHFSWWLDPKKFQNEEFDRMSWIRYQGQSSVGKPKYRLASGGPEEIALYGLLLRWAKAKEQDNKATLFDQEMLKQVKLLLEKLDQRFAGEKPVLQK